MNTPHPDEDRESARRISPAQLTAAARVLQHWFERVAPAVRLPGTALAGGTSDRQRAADAGGD
jgi:hypothetical protein